MRSPIRDTAWSLLAHGYKYRLAGALLAGAGLAVAACSGGGSPTASQSGPARDWAPSVVEQADVEAGGPVAVVSATSLAFGLTNCGASAQQTFTVQNAGTANLQITLSSSGSWFSVSPASAMIAPGASAVVTVAASVPSTAAAAKTQPGKVAIATNAAGQAHIGVPLSATAQGVTLAYPTPPNEVRFGATPPGTTVPAALVLGNTGNYPATVLYGTPSNPAFTLNSGDPANTDSATPGGSITQSIDFAPTAKGTVTATVPLSLESGTFCGNGVTSVKLSGAGVFGALSGWPTSYTLAGEGIDFGEVACGATGETQTFSLTNGSTKAVTIETATLSSDYAFSTDLTAGTVIPNNSSVLFEVTAPPIPYPSTPGATYTGTLTVTTNGASDAPHVLQLTEEARGAVLTVSGGSSFGTFGSVTTGTTASQPFTILNSGTDATITLKAADVPPEDVSPFGVTTTTIDSSSGLDEAQSFPDTLTFAPIATGSFSGTLTVTADALCQPAPGPISLSATGVSSESADGGEEDAGPALTASPTGTLDFFSTCATLPGSPITNLGSPRTVTVTNTSGAPVTFTASVGTSFFSVAPAGSTLGAGQSIDLTVTPAVVNGYPPAGGIANDSLVIQSSGQTLTVALEEDFAGLYLPTNSIAFGSVSAGTSSSQTVEIVDTQHDQLGASNITPDPPFQLQLANILDQTASPQAWIITFAPRTTGPFTGTAIFASSGVGLCTPNTIAVSGTGD
jgi:hypothetical protein